MKIGVIITICTYCKDLKDIDFLISFGIWSFLLWLCIKIQKYNLFVRIIQVRMFDELPD